MDLTEKDCILSSVNLQICLQKHLKTKKMIITFEKTILSSVNFKFIQNLRCVKFSKYEPSSIAYYKIIAHGASEPMISLVSNKLSIVKKLQTKTKARIYQTIYIVNYYCEQSEREVFQTL